ncbi:MAG: BMP family ABC transporter substrate-binding protein, partial [Dehalococcoidales bacterium]
PEVGLERAMILYNQGVDVIHNAASRTGLGIIEAAKKTGKLTTGTSGDQRYMAPGNVVGNRPKRVDTAVLLVIEELFNESFTSGIRSLGLKENGIMLGPFDESIVDDAMLERLEDLKKKIIEGQIVVHAE